MSISSVFVVVINVTVEREIANKKSFLDQN